jgi:hypothetical protein
MNKNFGVFFMSLSCLLDSDTQIYQVIKEQYRLLNKQKFNLLEICLFLFIGQRFDALAIQGVSEMVGQNSRVGSSHQYIEKYFKLMSGNECFCLKLDE